MRNSEKDRDFSWEQRQSGTEKPKQMNTQADTEPTASCSIMDWLFKYPEKCWSLKGQHWKPRINPDCLSYQQTHTYIHTQRHTYVHITDIHLYFPQKHSQPYFCMHPVLLSWKEICWLHFIGLNLSHTHPESPRCARGHTHKDPKCRKPLHPDTLRPHASPCTLSICLPVLSGRVPVCSIHYTPFPLHYGGEII